MVPFCQCRAWAVADIEPLHFRTCGIMDGRTGAHYTHGEGSCPVCNLDGNKRRYHRPIDRFFRVSVPGARLRLGPLDNCAAGYMAVVRALGLLDAECCSLCQ